MVTTRLNFEISTPLDSMDSIDFIMNLEQNIVEFTQIIFNYSFTILLNVFGINLNSLSLNLNEIK